MDLRILPIDTKSGSVYLDSAVLVHNAHRGRHCSRISIHGGLFSLGRQGLAARARGSDRYLNTPPWSCPNMSRLGWSKLSADI